MNKLTLYGDVKVNCYIIEDNKECYIVDPGSQKDKILEYINKNNLIVKGILLTHGHLDHIGAIDVLNVPIYVHENEYEVLEDDNKNCFALFNKEKPFKLEDLNIVKINEASKIILNNKEIKVIYTPGHTIGGTCYKFENDLYTGDTLFKGTIGRSDLPTSSSELLKQSIIKLIDMNDDNVNVYPGHGISSTIGEERRSNPYYLEFSKVAM